MCYNGGYSNHLINDHKNKRHVRRTVWINEKVTRWLKCKTTKCLIYKQFLQTGDEWSLQTRLRHLRQINIVFLSFFDPQGRHLQRFAIYCGSELCVELACDFCEVGCWLEVSWSLIWIRSRAKCTRKRRWISLPSKVHGNEDDIRVVCSNVQYIVERRLLGDSSHECQRVDPVLLRVSWSCFGVFPCSSKISLFLTLCRE